jgi:hypothetical protein
MITVIFDGGLQVIRLAGVRRSCGLAVITFSC